MQTLITSFQNREMCQKTVEGVDVSESGGGDDSSAWLGINLLVAGRNNDK